MILKSSLTGRETQTVEVLQYTKKMLLGVIFVLLYTVFDPD